MVIIKKPVNFEWDSGNVDKNKRKHNVNEKEAEEVFFDKNKVIYNDYFHSQQEKRYILLGQTRRERSLYIVFTKRGEKVRIISARDINKREVKLYKK
jgi:uncharacterized protein